MGNFECHKIEDLLFNTSFRSWVLEKNSKESDFWESWIVRNPDKSDLIQQAEAIIYALHINFKIISDSDIDAEIERALLRSKISSSELNDKSEDKKGIYVKIPPRTTFLLFTTAASLLIFFSFYLFNGRVINQNPGRPYDPFSAVNKNTFIEKINNSDSLLIINLPDGSKVSLGKNSRLNYTKNFSGSNREVYLTGEAFFEVKRNPARPFLVYTSSIITKVLGTSFKVKAYLTDKKSVVTVKTGKVSVFKMDPLNNSVVNEAEKSGIIVTPNQEIIYNRDKNEFNKILAEKPVIIARPVKQPFVFDGTPISKVFSIMQESYGIPIVYDEEMLSSCSLSATLGEDSFYDKLNLICKAINASYEMIDGTIVITSNGCR